jgi:undecaprenyl-diphosphatase
LDLFQAIFLGVLQGIFEWLPVSSQGTIAVASMLMGTNVEDALTLSLFLHTGTLFSAAVYFRKEIFSFFRGENSALLKFLLLSVIFSAPTGFLSYLFLLSFPGGSFFFLVFVSAMLFVTGILQLNKSFFGSRDLGVKNSFLLGLAQGFSVLPGVSRSGITVSALLFRGFSPQEAFRISFLLSIPSIFVAEVFFGALQGISFYFSFEAMIALCSAAVVGYLSIGFLLTIAKKIDFSLLCFVLSALYLSFAFLF